MAGEKASMFQGFKDFVMRGNVIDLAVAVVVGAAFGAVVKAFTDYIINPIIAALGGADAIGLGFTINGQFVDIGAVIGAIFSFLITMAVVYYVFVVPMNKARSMRATGEDETAVSDDVALLTEIRDLLAKRPTV